MSRFRLSLLLVIIVVSMHAFGQTCPANQPVEADRGHMFKKNERYSVYLPPSLAGCQSQFQQALSLWMFSDANFFNVSFNFTSNQWSATLPVRHEYPATPTDAGQMVPGTETDPASYGQGFPNAVIRINPNTTNCAAAARTFSHEIGHGFGLQDCHGCTNTIMRDAAGYNDTSGDLGPTSCDVNTARNAWESTVDSETDPDGPGGGDEESNCSEVGTITTSGPGSLQESCDSTPILIDLGGDGFTLTSRAAGVRFDLDANGVAESTSWTAAGSNDAFLAFDRNQNGVIDDGSELFGNHTWQPRSPDPNGFAALAVFDGNGDGVIDDRDAVFNALVLWQDRDHNGLSTADELQSLASAGVAAIHVDYKLSKKVDELGNRFRYRAKVDDVKNSSITRWAWDVIFATQP